MSDDYDKIIRDVPPIRLHDFIVNSRVDVVEFLRELSVLASEAAEFIEAYEQDIEEYGEDYYEE